MKNKQKTFSSSDSHKSDCKSRDHLVDLWSGHILCCDLDMKIFLWPLLILPLIQEWHLSVNGKRMGLKYRLTTFYCYVPGVTRKELGNQIMTNYYSQESQQQALFKSNNLLRNDKIINYQKQWKICTIKESLIYSTLILSPNCPSELTHTNPSTVSDPQISKSYCNFK